MTLSLFLKDAELISSLHAAKLLSFSGAVGLKLFSVWLALEKLRLLCCSVWRSLLGRYGSHHATFNRVNGHYGRQCFLLKAKQRQLQRSTIAEWRKTNCKYQGYLLLMALAFVVMWRGFNQERHLFYALNLFLPVKIANQSAPAKSDRNFVFGNKKTWEIS